MPVHAREPLGKVRVDVHLHGRVPADVRQGVKFFQNIEQPPAIFVENFLFHYRHITCIAHRAVHIPPGNLVHMRGIFFGYIQTGIEVLRLARRRNRIHKPVGYENVVRFLH